MSGRDESLAKLAARYERFAAIEAGGSSPRYERLARRVAGSPALLAFIASLPAERRQPNLFFAAVRATAGLPADEDALEDIIGRAGDAVREVMLTRTTQTNEPARCAVLLPALARLPQPLALLEVGAAAGLCLLPDRYGYDYGGARILPRHSDDPRAPVFPCAANPQTPVPSRPLEIVWRAGLDLNPLDPRSAADADWLRTLIWPEHTERARRLNAALELARADPPTIVRGDLRSDLPDLAARAPRDATLVIFHTAVLGYVRGQPDRDRFAEAVRGLGATWISNEAPAVYPAFLESAAVPPAPARNLFLLAIDGVPSAWTAPHGQSLDWFG